MPRIRKTQANEMQAGLFDLSPFLKTAPCVPALRKLVADGVEDTEALFRDYRWTLRPKQGQTTLASSQTLAMLRTQVCSPAAHDTRS